MAKGTVLAELTLSGEQSFKQAIRSSGDRMDDARDDAFGLSGALGVVGQEFDGARDDSVGLAGALQVLQGSADEAGDEARSLALMLYGLASAGDEAGDELFETAAETSVATGAFNTLSLSAGNASVSVGTFSSVLTLSLIPAVITLSTVLAPLAATLGVVAASLGGVVAGFGAVLGMGAVGHVKELQAAFKDVVSDLLPFVKLVGQQFTPLLFDAVEALTPLGFRILEAMGPLDEFADSLRTLGELAMDAIPMVVGGLLDLGRDAVPVLEDVVRWLMTHGPGAFNAMQGAAARFIPIVMDIVDALVDIAPTLLEFGTVVAETILPVLPDLIRGFGDVMQYVLALDPQLRSLVIAGTALAPVLAGAASILTGPLAAGLALVGGLVAGFATDWAGMRTTVMGAVRDIGNVVTEVFGTALGPAFDDLMGTMETLKVNWGALFKFLTERVKVGLAIIGAGITQIIDGVVTVVGSIINMIRTAVEAGKALKEGDISGAAEAMSQGGARQQELFQGLQERTRERGARVAKTVADVREDQTSLGEVFSTGTPSNAFVNRATAPGAAADSSQQDVRVVMDLKNEMLEAQIEDGAATVVQRESDQARFTGGPSP